MSHSLESLAIKVMKVIKYVALGPKAQKIRIWWITDPSEQAEQQASVSSDCRDWGAT